MNLGTKFVLFTLSRAQRSKVCREIFTAIFSEGHATESYKIFTAYLAYFDLGIDLSAEKFSYSSEQYKLTEQSKAALDLDQLVALKTGNTSLIPDTFLHKLFCS